MSIGRRPVRIAAAAAFASLTAAASGAIKQNPMPLTAPTGYRDYCDGMSVRQQRHVCGRGVVPGAFWRPLKLPAVAEGQPCPVSRRHPISKNLTGVGAGPVYFTHAVAARLEEDLPRPLSDSRRARRRARPTRLLWAGWTSTICSDAIRRWWVGA